MSIYGLKYVDGRFEEIVASNDEDAVAAALARFDPAAVAAEQWDADGMTDTDEPMERLLIWPTEGDAENNAGQHAIAELVAPADR